MNTAAVFNHTIIFISAGGCFETDYDYAGNDINADPNDKDYGRDAGKRDSPEDCQRLCQDRQDCAFFTYKERNKECWLKTSDAGRHYQERSNAISGKKYCGNFPPSVHQVMAC